jgi:hypothetical protein
MSEEHLKTACWLKDQTQKKKVNRAEVLGSSFGQARHGGKASTNQRAPLSVSL